MYRRWVFQQDGRSVGLKAPEKQTVQTSAAPWGAG